MKKQQGFTLIELMIVVAVIGVLSAIAIPKYQQYVKKGAIGAALASVSAYKTDIEDKIAFSGHFPDVSAAFGIGKITSTKALVTSASTHTITAEITEGSANGTKVQLTRASGDWSCKHNGTDVEITGCKQETSLQ